jgi:protein phosphatase
MTIMAEAILERMRQSVPPLRWGGRLEVEFGHATEPGRRRHNEDSFGAATPEDERRRCKGLAFAVADGVSGNGGGREAAECTVRGVLSDYYATPETWNVPYALDKVLAAINRWLLAQAVAHRELQGMASTLSLLVLRGPRYWIAHVGDSRIYRLRAQSLERLTNDHVWERPDLHHVLRRAVGLDQRLAVDYSEGELAAGDVFLLATDGVWKALGERRIHEILRIYGTPWLAAETLVREALAQAGHDNATALVVRVKEVPPQEWSDLACLGCQLALPPRLKPGQPIDDFVVETLLHESRTTLLYRVRHRESGQVLVLKTLQGPLREDRESREALLFEEWLAGRMLAHYFPQVVPMPPGSRSVLYYVMTYHPGATLQQHLDQGRHFSVAEAVSIGLRLGKALGHLHRMQVLHRDVKPANVHLGSDGRLRVLDLGAAALHAGRGVGACLTNPGTPRYMAPECIVGMPASVQSDLYAAGVSLYHLLTRRYPYGEIEPFQRPRFGDPVPPSRYRPDIPLWFEEVILKAVARDTRHRFETAEEMVLALERADQRPIGVRRVSPLVERDPLVLWQWLALASLAMNLVLIYLVMAGA